MIEITKSDNVRECQACCDYETTAYHAHMYDVKIGVDKEFTTLKLCRYCLSGLGVLCSKAVSGAEITGTIKLWGFFAFSFIALLANGHGII